MRNIFYLLLSVAISFSCNQDKGNGKKPVSDSLKIQDTSGIDTSYTMVVEEILTRRDSVNEFLIQPFDLFKFKKIKGQSNSGVGRKKKYYFRPDEEGMYYHYGFFPDFKGYLGVKKDSLIRKEDGLEINVYKELGAYRDKYLDPTEILIEFRAKFNDPDLPELAFVGLDSTDILNKLGKQDFYIQNCLVYQYENKVLILKITESKVAWLKYVRVKKELDLEQNIDLFEM